MTRTGTYKILKQHSGHSHYAQVSVELVPAAEFQLVRTGSALAWLFEAYGPNAVTDGTWNAMEQPMREGALRAFADSKENVSRVDITLLRTHPAHGGPGDVRYATYRAVLDALNAQVSATQESVCWCQHSVASNDGGPT